MVNVPSLVSVHTHTLERYARAGRSGFDSHTPFHPATTEHDDTTIRISIMRVWYSDRISFVPFHRDIHRWFLFLCIYSDSNLSPVLIRVSGPNTTACPGGPNT